jgi:hypothetical protein
MDIFFKGIVSLYSTHPPFSHTLFNDPKHVRPADITTGLWVMSQPVHHTSELQLVNSVAISQSICIKFSFLQLWSHLVHAPSSMFSSPNVPPPPPPTSLPSIENEWPQLFHPPHRIMWKCTVREELRSTLNQLSHVFLVNPPFIQS